MRVLGLSSLRGTEVKQQPQTWLQQGVSLLSPVHLARLIREQTSDTQCGWSVSETL